MLDLVGDLLEFGLSGLEMILISIISTSNKCTHYSNVKLSCVVTCGLV